jgi:hypothetical protein
MTQTAVNWLIDEIKNFDSGRSKYYSKISIYNHAYRMEKEQIIDANIAGMKFIAVDPTLYQQDAEQYYNETYESKNNS